ncbi:hypothetical protein ACE6H2_014029 [Prunus campanulata]
MSVAALITSISNNIWTYSALRFISGFGRASIGTCALVLLTEKVGEQWRGRASFTAHCFNFFVTKSPRWLFMPGREDEAISVLKQIGSAVEDKSLTVYFLSLPHEKENKNTPKLATTIFSSMKSLFEKTWAFKRILAVITLGTGIGLVYYGMPFGALHANALPVNNGWPSTCETLPEETHLSSLFAHHAPGVARMNNGSFGCCSSYLVSMAAQIAPPAGPFLLELNELQNRILSVHTIT